MSFLQHNVVLHWFPYRASRQCLSNKGFCAPSLCSSFFAWPLYLIILGWYLSWLLHPSLTSHLNWDHEMNAEAVELSPAERSSETPTWKACMTEIRKKENSKHVQRRHVEGKYKNWKNNISRKWRRTSKLQMHEENSWEDGGQLLLLKTFSHYGASLQNEKKD